MEWMVLRQKFLPLMIIRRYLKLVYNYCSEKNMLNKQIEEIKGMALPFEIRYLPLSYPAPSELVLNK